jgi:hypothetical protein
MVRDPSHVLHCLKMAFQDLRLTVADIPFCDFRDIDHELGPLCQRVGLNICELVVRVMETFPESWVCLLESEL